MKRTFKIIIKKDNDVKAIVDLDGKILTNDRRLKSKLEVLIKDDMITQSYEKGVNKTSYEKITNEMQLYAHLKNELSLSGYDVE